MQTRFLLGPSGTGKTFRCLAEVREALTGSPQGPPLLFLAPKQATFQLERQLLADSELMGYTRLQILSFERLAEFVLNECSVAPPQLLSEEGRLMVLRALLARKRTGLQLFHATAHLRGFAQQLSKVIRELSRAQISPRQLRELARSVGQAARLDAKLYDLANLLEAYAGWLDQHGLQDSDRLLDSATAVLHNLADSPNRSDTRLSGAQTAPSMNQVRARKTERPTDKRIRIAGLWLDGFAEMSVQEIDLLVGLLPFCDRATLAFNLDPESIGRTSWLATWSLIGQTFRQLQRRLQAQPGIELTIEWLERDQEHQRFADNPVLWHLERHWSEPKVIEEMREDTSTLSNAISKSLRVVACANREAEATLAAREILRFVRSGGRFRDVAVLVRKLDQYYNPIRRIFASYEIPLFLDRREPVGHHPLAELTRSALRTLVFHWQTEDWFGALKTGLIHTNETEIDRLENEALARGWKGKQWQMPFRIHGDAELERWVEPLRRRLIAPVQELERALGSNPTGQVMADSLLTFWRRLRVVDELERWSVESRNVVHVTFWEQMQLWLANLSLAFSNERLPLREWLPIIEAGLASQTVGVIPPALDQVLVGAADRTRNPDLRLAILLGMNESVFPSPPPAPTLLSETDRDRLAELQATLGPPRRSALGQERYLGYVACTRARERLVVTYALRDENDNVLNPSPFIADLQRLFPSLQAERQELAQPLAEAEHASDLLAPVLQARSDSVQQSQALAHLRQTPPFAMPLERIEQFLSACRNEQLSVALAEKLYGDALATSVSRLENFAACPFKFFVDSGLRAKERKQFELDAREQGSFQHEVLALFHQTLVNEDKQWRDLMPGEARGRIATAAASLVEDYRNGLLIADDQSLFNARSMTLALQDFIETLTLWMDQYEFDPQAVELGFGQKGDPLPAWKLQLDENHQILFRGKIDRVDIRRRAEGKEVPCVVIDYKSSAKKLDATLMEHGIQLQLTAYLNVLRSLPEAAAFFGFERIIPAGVFYVNLRGRYENGTTRREVLRTVNNARKLAYKHAGRFDATVVRQLDRRDMAKGDQFNYSFNQNGELSRGAREALDAAAFKQMLDVVEKHLLKMGRAIFAGVARVDPYQKGSLSACDQCYYHAICRIDPWTHHYRVLKKAQM